MLKHSLAVLATGLSMCGAPERDGDDEEFVTEVDATAGFLALGLVRTL